jgi:membrane-associated phospholipid phosphatase
MTLPRRTALAIVVACVLIPLCQLFVDRPLATWSHDVLGRPHWSIVLQTIPEPILPGASILIGVSGLAAGFGWRPGYWGRTMIAACVAALLAIVLKDQLKYVFGHTWPDTWVNNNPSWIQNGVYGFFPFHGGAGWASFPSGHTTTVTAPGAVLWVRAPRLRVLWSALIALTVIGLIGANYHFLGDCLAGMFLGVAVAAGVMALIPEYGALNAKVASSATDHA